MRVISFVDVIVDKPKTMWLQDVIARLNRSRLNGMDVLATITIDRHRSDEVDIPHVGHDIRCADNLDRCNRLSTIGNKAGRIFDLTLVVDGNVDLVSLPHIEYKVGNDDIGYAMVAVSVAYNRTSIPDELRWELEPYGDMDNA